MKTIEFIYQMTQTFLNEYLRIMSKKISFIFYITNRKQMKISNTFRISAFGFSWNFAYKLFRRLPRGFLKELEKLKKNSAPTFKNEYSGKFRKRLCGF